MEAARRPVLALDIGGTKLAVAIVTPDGVSHGFAVEPTRREEGPDAVIARLFRMGDEAIRAWSDGQDPLAGASAVTAGERGGERSVAAVGISCGGPLDARRGVLINPLHLPGWLDVPITELAERRFGLPAVLENDATAAALAEYRFGAGAGSSTLVYLTVSTGVGGGAVINGRLHRGASSNGGEYGHIMVQPGGRLCLCGRRGCLEAYASGTSIAERARELLERSDRPSSLRDRAVVRAEDVSAAADGGDELAGEIWAETLELLASAVTDLVNILEPDMVVLGGGVTRAGASLIEPLRHAVLRDAMPPASAAVRVELAARGDEVGVIGAAALAFDLLRNDSTNQEPARV